MPSITFTDDDLSAIAFERYYHPEPFVQRKLEVLWLKAQGLTHRANASNSTPIVAVGLIPTSVQPYDSPVVRPPSGETHGCYSSGRFEQTTRPQAA